MIWCVPKGTKKSKIIVRICMYWIERRTENLLNLNLFYFFVKIVTCELIIFATAILHWFVESMTLSFIPQLINRGISIHYTAYIIFYIHTFCNPAIVT